MDFKSCKLINFHKELFDKNVTGAHDARIDARMTYDIYNALREKIPSECILKYRVET